MRQKLLQVYEAVFQDFKQKNTTNPEMDLFKGFNTKPFLKYFAQRHVDVAVSANLKTENFHN